MPSHPDVVIAGSVCVEFSSVKPRPKVMDELGQSADTFAAIRQFMTDHKPRFPILKNIIKAPWEAANQFCLSTISARSSKENVVQTVSGILDTMTILLLPDILQHHIHGTALSSHNRGIEGT